MTRPTLPDGPRAPRAAQTLRWGVRPGAFMEECAERYGDMFTMRIAHEGTWVFVTDPDVVKQVFTGDPRLLHAGEGNRILLPLLGNQSVLLLDDDPHLRQRKLMLPPFHGERMQGYRDLMVEATERELERWPRDRPFEVWPHMQGVTLEVIVRAVFGMREGERLEQMRDLLAETLRQAMLPSSMALLGLVGPERFARLGGVRRGLEPVDSMIIDEIRRRRDEPDLAERDDVLSLLVQARHEDGSPMGDRELRDQLMTLLVAGHETTATTLAWAIERLVRHPEALERLKAELAEGRDEYLDAVVKETLRLRPVIPIVIRKLVEPMEIGGRLLPAGVGVCPCIYLLHRREDVYPDARRFRPERFLEQPAGTYTWIPFGGGIRRCLGASFALFEMKTVLSTILTRRDVAGVRPQPERIRRRAISLAPQHGGEVVAFAEERSPGAGRASTGATV